MALLLDPQGKSKNYSLNMRVNGPESFGEVEKSPA
jgi:hypothetical protein